MADIRVEGIPAITALLATVDRVECRAMAVHTQPRATAVVVGRALRAAVDIPRVAAVGILPVAVVADTAAVGVATLVEAIAKRSNELM